MDSHTVLCCADCLQDTASSTAAAQELPGVCAQTLLQIYEQQAPPHLQAVLKQALKKQLRQK